MFLSRAKFEELFTQALDDLQKAERVTKDTLRVMSRDLLIALHAPDVDGSTRGDIAYINRLLAVLTPMNRRTAVLFFKEFSGFHYEARNPKSGTGSDSFAKKDRKNYHECEERALKALADPHFNIWTWADIHVKIEKEYDIKSVTKAVEKALDKTDGDQAAVLRAVIAAGITPKALEIVLMEMAQAVVEGDKPVEEPAPF